ncbi:MAG: sugar phosphate isomerase/epimerase family protein, partial [bacterium]
RSAVNTLTDAVDMVLEGGSGAVNGGGGAAGAGTTTPRPLPLRTVCTVVDAYHLWWDPRLEDEIRRAGEEGLLGAFHVSDWKVPTEDLLLDRGLMGEGCIDLPQVRQWVDTAGFEGFIEVEILSRQYWSLDQAEWLAMIVQACRESV